MTFGIIFALEKMKDKKIFCSSPNKVVGGGMTNWVCFDKTGTLTEDFMDFNCLVLCDKGTFLEPIINDNDELLENTTTATHQTAPKNKNLINAIQNFKSIETALNNMAMNHTIVYV